MTLAKSLYYGAGAAWAAATKRRPVGRNIYSDDWDICIVLDSARFDLFRDAVADSPLQADVGAAWSRGSITTEWLTQTFRPPHGPDIADTSLVTATPHSQTVFGDGEWLTNADEVVARYPENPAVSRDAFAEMHEVWRTHATDHGAVPPDVMRDATIEAYRGHGSRIVAHWMQPHEPFTAPSAKMLGGGPTEKNVWAGLRSGEYDADTIWQSYRANLEWALTYVADVLTAVDADVLITADHGNAFGELGVYGHPFGFPQPAVRKVPWATTQAVNLTDYHPSGVLDDAEESTPAADQLKALGYR